MNALANMGANMSAMLSGALPLTETQSDNAEDIEIGAVEMPLSSAPANSPVTNPTQMTQYKVQKMLRSMGVLKLLPLQSVREGLKRTHPHLLK